MLKSINALLGWCQITQQLTGGELETRGRLEEWELFILNK